MDEPVLLDDTDVESVRARDRDLSRGMGNHLRWPHSVQSSGTSGTKRSHPNDPHAGHPAVVPVVTPAADSIVPRGPHRDETHSRVTRPRRQPSHKPAVLPSSARPRIPVSQRWFYDPVPVPSNPIALITLPLSLPPSVGSVGNSGPNGSKENQSSDVLGNLVYDALNDGSHETQSSGVIGNLVYDALFEKPHHSEVQNFVTNLSSSLSRPPLKPRQPWMLDGDSRSDVEADADWNCASDRLFGKPPSSVLLGVSDPPQGSVTTAQVRALANADSSSSAPYVPVDLSHAYLPPVTSRESFTSIITRWVSFPRKKVLHLNAKAMRRILAARESIFKYGIYLPRNDRDADASPESLRWNSGRQLEWLRLKKVEAFEYDWTKDRLAREYPHYLFSDIGHLFYIYDYKFSGEHRVRLPGHQHIRSNLFPNRPPRIDQALSYLRRRNGLGHPPV